MPTVTQAVMLLLDQCAMRIAERVRAHEPITVGDPDLMLINALATSYPGIYDQWAKRGYNAN